MPDLDPQKQRAFALDIVGRLRARGFESLWAGGCVRDQLLARIPKDYDVATSATPAEVREVFGSRRTVAVGAAFGVMTVVGPAGAGHIEVATFRQDSAYSDGRHPDAVEFSTPQAEALRRDFTINGLFYDPLDDRVIDFVGGKEDLARGMVRAIGDPRSRFEEDKLRLLRAVRFAATLDFSVEPVTRDAVEAMADEINVVSAERIAAEMRLMLLDPSRRHAIELLRDVKLLDNVLPELATLDVVDSGVARRTEDNWLTALASLHLLAEPTLPLALTALLRPFVDADGSYKICRRWKLSNHDSERTRWLIENQGVLRGAREFAWSKLQRILIAEGIDELLALDEAIARARGDATQDVEYCRERLKTPRADLDPQPLLSGDDLIEHGVPRGKNYKVLLEGVRTAQLDGQIATKQEALTLVDRLRREGGPEAG